MAASRGAYLGRLGQQGHTFEARLVYKASLFTKEKIILQLIFKHIYTLYIHIYTGHIHIHRHAYVHTRTHTHHKHNYIRIYECYLTLTFDYVYVYQTIKLYTLYIIYHFLELGLNKAEKVKAHIRILKTIQGDWRDGIGVKTTCSYRGPMWPFSLLIFFKSPTILANFNYFIFTSKLNLYSFII